MPCLYLDYATNARHGQSMKYRYTQSHLVICDTYKVLQTRQGEIISKIKH
uniref:Uncharacterized protein n=1 Tax=Arion vulgaris TaxID=1028688 RepID=A0A0B7A9P9_9EUPU